MNLENCRIQRVPDSNWRRVRHPEGHHKLVTLNRLLVVGLVPLEVCQWGTDIEEYVTAFELLKGDNVTAGEERDQFVRCIISVDHCHIAIIVYGLNWRCLQDLRRTGVWHRCISEDRHHLAVWVANWFDARALPGTTFWSRHRSGICSLTRTIK